MATILRNYKTKCITNITYALSRNRSHNNIISKKYFNTDQYLFRNKIISSFNILSNKRSIHTSLPLKKIIPFYLSDIGEGIREVSVVEWYVKVGDTIQQFDNVCEVQSDKASVTITSRYDGKVTKLYHKVDAVAFVGEPLIDVDVEDESSSENKEEDNQNNVTDSNDDDVNLDSLQKTKVLATPAVRRIALQNKIDLNSIKATGRGGRILKEDLLKYLNITSEDSNDVDKMKKIEQSTQKTPISTPSSTTIQSVRSVKPIGEDKTVPIVGYTKVMVKTMTASLKIPHFVYSDEIDVSSLVKVRNETKKAAAEAGVSLTFMPFFIKAASLALNSFPILNSTVDEKCEKLTYRAAHNIGIAMDTPGGLIVPNIKNVQQKSIFEVGLELNRLQKDGQNASFKPEDLIGGTFALSNIGIIGGTYTKPVILTPQVSIGALGKMQVLPRFDENGNIVKAHIICVSWSADHRIVDGVTMARFSNKWKFYVENPNHLMLDL